MYSIKDYKVTIDYKCANLQSTTKLVHFLIFNNQSIHALGES